MPDMIKVTIECEQRVRYAKTVAIPAEKYAAYEKLCDAGDLRALDKWCADFADEWIDVQRDWLDGGDFEQVEIEPVMEGEMQAAS